MKPYLFDEFFASGMEESISPFLTRTSRRWAHNLALRSALASALLLAIAFTFSFFVPVASAICLLFIYFLVGTPAFLGAIEDLKKFEINIDVLMTLAALLSILIGSVMEGALLLVLFELSGAMENAVLQKSKNTILHLHELAPRMVTTVDPEGRSYERSIKEVQSGEKLLIKAGEIVPLDGIVLEGNSFVNLAHLTGESKPTPKKPGDSLAAGSRNLDGSLFMQVTHTSADSTLSRIIELIATASDSKPKLARLIDRFGKRYATTIIVLFFLFALGLPLLIPSMHYLGIEGGIYRALTFLIAASPCALVIATPTAYWSAINSCAKKGILLKGGVALDGLVQSKAVAFDKTGTLTTGKLKCDSVQLMTPEAPLTLSEALSVAAGLERHAIHPIAEAILAKASHEKISFAKIEQFQAHAGRGLEGNFRGTLVAIGNGDFIAEKIPETLRGRLQELRERTMKSDSMHTLLLVGNSLFLFHFSDTIRKEAKALITALQKEKQLRLLMLTGDRPEIARQVAQELGITEVHAGLKPEDKLMRVAEITEKEGLIMVGDGINDAPALARATVGISMGKIGTATAVDASDIIFLNDDLSLIHWLHNKASKTVQIVKQNLLLSLGIILFATTPALLGLVPLWLAVILHEGGTVLVGLNSLRLLRR